MAGDSADDAADHARPLLLIWTVLRDGGRRGRQALQARIHSPAGRLDSSLLAMVNWFYHRGAAERR